jgi:hypothetical protein
MKMRMLGNAFDCHFVTDILQEHEMLCLVILHLSYMVCINCLGLLECDVPFLVSNSLFSVNDLYCI